MNESRFLAKIDKTPGCWHWAAGKDGIGYGRHARYLGETRAHRLSYRLFKGEIPSGLKVLHTCDVRHCVNPNHLWLGTQADNVADMIQKGRSRHGDLRGEKNGQARLTPERVAQIRKLRDVGYTYTQLAEEFGVSRMTANRAARGVSWSTVPS